MSRSAPIYFTRVGETKTGRGLYKLSNGKGRTFGRAFCIKPETFKPTTRRRKTDGR